MYLSAFGGSGLLHLLAAHPRVAAVFGIAATVSMLASPLGSGRFAGTADHLEKIERSVNDTGLAPVARQARAEREANGAAGEGGPGGHRRCGRLRASPLRQGLHRSLDGHYRARPGAVARRADPPRAGPGGGGRPGPAPAGNQSRRPDPSNTNPHEILVRETRFQGLVLQRSGDTRRTRLEALPYLSAPRHFLRWILSTSSACSALPGTLTRSTETAHVRAAHRLSGDSLNFLQKHA